MSSNVKPTAGGLNANQLFVIPLLAMAKNLLSYKDLFENLSLIVAILGFIASAIFGIIIAYKRISLSRKKRILEKNFGAGLFGAEVIKTATRYYVPADCVNRDPTKQPEIKNKTVAIDNIFKAVQRHLSDNSDHKYFIVLADSGMGKTAFLLNYYLYNQNLPKSNRQKIYMMPLGLVDSLAKISKVPEKENTIIFLDALDEDVKAMKDHKNRLDELLKACCEFKKILITCRTQFFAKEEQIPDTTNIIRVGPRKPGQPGKYKFYKLYLAPLTDNQIAEHLKKRYPFWKHSQREKARRTIQQIPLLSVRPMLLTYIPDLIENSTEINFTYQLYNKIVESWLKREDGWINPERLLTFSQQLSFDIFLKKEIRGQEQIPRLELEKMGEENHISINEKKILHSRSLLNRDAEGNCKFAHRAIMEFLFVQYFLNLPYEERPQIEWTDIMKQFLSEMLRHAPMKADLSKVDLSGRNLEKTDLRKTNLRGANLEGTNLGGADLKGSNMNGCGLLGANFKGARFSGTDLKGANLNKIDLTECTIVCEINTDLQGEKSKGAFLIVHDPKTNLEWHAGLDKNTTWDEANQWVATLSIDGGGWRMPKIEELRSLYKKTFGTRNMTPLFKTTGWYVWSEERDSSSAWDFNFYDGYDNWYDRKNSNFSRGFAVRSRGR